MDANQENEDLLKARIKTSLQKVESSTSQLRKTNTLLTVLGVVNSSIATLITAVTAAMGPVIGEGPSGWRISCIIGAVFAFGATLCVGLDKQLKTTDRLSKANQVVGRLRFLDLAIDTGHRSRAEITGEFEDLFKAYPDVVV